VELRWGSPKPEKKKLLHEERAWGRKIKDFSSKKKEEGVGRLGKKRPQSPKRARSAGKRKK